MLSFAEEILLLMLDDEDGSFVPVRESAVEYALAGAALMDLAFANRIDTDPDRLVLLDRQPTGHAIHDRVLDRIARSSEIKDTKSWLEMIARHDSTDIRDQALASLIEKKILEAQEEKFLWVFRARRYPTIDGRTQREVKRRITDVLLSEEVPDPRDVAIIGLAEACDILREVFAGRELNRIRPRIEQVRKLDLLGREVSGAILEIERSISMAMMHAPH